jgi:hypothetical protein
MSYLFQEHTLQKVKPFLCLIKRFSMGTYGGVKVQIHVFLASALV